MSNRIIESTDLFSRSDVALNSTAVATGDFVCNSGGFVTTASTPTNIIGLSNQTKTYTADNDTVALEKLSYTVKTDFILVRSVIEGGAVTNADEGKFFMLATKSTVNGLTSNVTIGTLKLVKFISSTLGDFQIV